MKLGWKGKLSSKKSQLKRFFKVHSRDSSPFIIEETNPQKRESKRSNFPAEIAIQADTGDALDQLQCEKAYYSATLIGDDFEIAFAQVHRSAEQGSMEAQFKLGNLYALGHGTSKSSSDAYTWYTKAAIQGYKKALIRIHNLYQEDIKMHCRGQINSEEEEWADDDFKKKNKIRELNEYRLEQQKSILNGAISYYTEQFKIYQSSNQKDPSIQMSLAFLYQHGYGVKKCTRWAFEYYTLAAEQGSTDAQYNLGDLYQKHNNMKFNYRHAFKWYTKSAQGGHRTAQRSLAYFYLKGLGTEVDYSAAIFWYKKAGEAGDTEAMVILGKHYRKGDCIIQDLPMAVRWYTLAARQGNIVAQNCLSQLHQRGMLDNVRLDDDMLEYLTEPSMNRRLCTKLSADLSKVEDLPSLRKLNELAKRALIGDGQAMYEIGLKYLKGSNDLVQDEGTGMKWIKNAANAKNKDAQLSIAALYKNDKSAEQDYHRTAIWYKTLARQKDAVSQCIVGAMYNEGLGVRQDPLEASKWFIWAADQGNSDAQYNLARLRLEGRGVGQDEKEAVELYHQSAKQRNIRSCYNLGEIYLEGRYKVDKNEIRGFKLMEFAAKNGSIQAQLEMAYQVNRVNVILKCKQNEIEYLTMAADAGSKKAQYQLAVKYLEGNGVDQDYVKAYSLFKQAETQESLFAQDLVQSLNTHSIPIADYSKILEMLIEVTKKGLDNLQYNIGIAYEINSNGVKAMEWYKAASEIGDFRADYRLGIMHDKMDINIKDNSIAREYYERASLHGHSDASHKLACMYLHEYGVTKDLLKAYHYFTKASMMGHQEARKIITTAKNTLNKPLYFDELTGNSLQLHNSGDLKISMLEKTTEEGYTQLQYQLGLWYENRYDYFRAFKWYSLAAEAGVTDAYYRLGTIYQEGKHRGYNNSMAANMYWKAVEKEHEDACYRLGQLYQHGNGVELDYLKAYEFYKKARDMDHVEAYKVLNITLETKINSNGRVQVNVLDPLSQEYQDSISMCKYVAEHGDTEVQFKLGFAYEYNTSESKYTEAVKWYSMAAKDSHREAMYHLGLLHEKGLGTSQDCQKAIQLYEQASKLGSGDAYYRLGHIYHHGNGVGISPKKAIEYYTLSAKLGNPEYQCSLGMLYEEGELVQRSPIEALKWYTKAYLQGYDTISLQLDNMYIDKQYEDFFLKKLIQNLSIASRGDFRLRKEYNYFYYGRLNFKLGIFYAFGYGTDKDLKKAWNYFSKGYSDHTFKTEDILSLWSVHGSSKIRDILKAFGDDEALLDKIDKVHLCKLGMYFFDGVVHTSYGYTTISERPKYDPKPNVVIEINYSVALKFLKKAAKKNHVKAMLMVGTVYHCCGVNIVRDQHEKRIGSTANGNILDVRRTVSLYHTSRERRNFSLAFQSYKDAEARFNEDLRNMADWKREDVNEYLQLCLGLLYEYGDGVMKNYQKALACYKMGAYNNHTFGLHRLALMYYYGKGVPVNCEKAFDLFQKSQVGGRCLLNLPFVYVQDESNVGVFEYNLIYRILSRDEIKGENHFYLGQMYKYGLGVPLDKKKAQYQFRLAQNYKCKRAKHEMVH